MTTHLGWTVDYDGFVQVDWVAYSQQSIDDVDPATGAPLNEETISIRRAFLRAEAHREAYFAEAELDGDTVAGPAARLVTSQVGWSPNEKFSIAGGLMLIPFGATTSVNARYRSFLEQPTFIKALFPGDVDAGVHESGEYGMLRWSFAAMNGAPVDDAQWKGRDPVSSYDLLARVGAVVPLPAHGRIEAGVSGLTGTGLHPGTGPTKDSVQWVDENQDGIVQITELQVIPGTPGEPSQTFHRDALDGDLAVHWCLAALGLGVVQFETALAKNLDRGVIYADPIARSRDIRELGYSLGVVQDLGDRAMAGVRYDWYDADRDANEREGVSTVPIRETFSTLALMAALKWTTARLTFEYDHVDNPFGRDDTGMPTTQRADRFTIRGQVEF